MAVATILTRFRDISDITTTQFDDTTVEDQVYPVALSRYNHIMDTSETITSDTTGDELKDEILANLCASYCWRKLYKKAAFQDKKRYKVFDQDAYAYMQEIDPSKFGINTDTLDLFPLYKNRGKPYLEFEIGVL